MSQTAQKSLSSTKIEVSTDHVLVHEFKISGQPAQRVIEGTLQGIDAEITLKKILDFGSLALDSVQSESIRQHLDSATENFAKLIGKEANENFPRVIEEKTQKFVESILKFLDPSQTQSLNSQLEASLKSFKKEITTQISEDMKHQRASLDEGLKNLGFLKKAFDSSTQKGIPHQDYVGEVLERFAGEDVVSDLSGDSNGSAYASGRSKSGDYRVTIGDTFGTANPISISVEAKNSKLSEKAALKEIQENCDNRGTSVGIIVFAELSQAPTQGRSLKIFPGNKILVVCDNENETPLYAALMYARGIAKMLASNIEFNHSKIINQIEEVLKHLDIEDAINKDAKAARNAVDRLVSTALTARLNALKVVSEIQKNA